MSEDREWHRVMDLDGLPEGRVTTVVAGHRTLALTHHEGRYGALDNHCPHQGGPLGEGSIENGVLRCPWHGYDYDPLTGQPPPPFDDAPACFPVEVRDDGIWVGIPPEEPRRRTVADEMVETMVNWGVTHVFGMVGHSNLGFADAMREAEGRGELTYIGIRHEGAAAFAASGYAKLTGRPAACFAIAGPGSTNMLTGLYDAKVDRAPVLAVSGAGPLEGRRPRSVPGSRSRRRLRRCRALLSQGAGGQQRGRADLAGDQERAGRARRRASHPPGRDPDPAVGSRRGRPRRAHRLPGDRAARR